MAALAPLVKKLAERSPLDSADTNLILALPRRIVRFEPGTYLVREGDIVKTCCVVLSGFVCRTKITGSGSKQILSIYLKGDLVDIHNSFFSEADHNVQALTNATLAFIRKHDMIDLIEQRPAIRKAVWLDMLADAAILREWLLSVGQRNAYARVAHLICEMALRQRAAGLCKDMVLEWPMTQEQFGYATGLTAVHINRTLKSLRAEGLITITRTTVSIVNWNGLTAAADFTERYLHQSKSLVPA